MDNWCILSYYSRQLFFVISMSNCCIMCHCFCHILISNCCIMWYSCCKLLFSVIFLLIIAVLCYISTDNSCFLSLYWYPVVVSYFSGNCYWSCCHHFIENCFFMLYFGWRLLLFSIIILISSCYFLSYFYWQLLYSIIFQPTTIVFCHISGQLLYFVIFH